MSRTIRLAALTAVAAAVAGCFIGTGTDEPIQEEIVYVNPEPISVEPVFQGKYGYN